MKMMMKKKKQRKNVVLYKKKLFLIFDNSAASVVVRMLFRWRWWWWWWWWAFFGVFGCMCLSSLYLKYVYFSSPIKLILYSMQSCRATHILSLLPTMTATTTTTIRTRTHTRLFQCMRLCACMSLNMSAWFVCHLFSRSVLCVSMHVCVRYGVWICWRYNLVDRTVEFSSLSCVLCLAFQWLSLIVCEWCELLVIAGGFFFSLSRARIRSLSRSFVRCCCYYCTTNVLNSNCPFCLSEFWNTHRRRNETDYNGTSKRYLTHGHTLTCMHAFEPIHENITHTFNIIRYFIEANDTYGLKLIVNEKWLCRNAYTTTMATFKS